VNDRLLIEVIHSGHDAVLEFLFGATLMWRRTERASLEKKPSMRLSQERCLRVKVGPSSETLHRGRRDDTLI
jgi:hypothetical protein